MYQLKSMPQLLAGVRGNRSWDSGIALGVVGVDPVRAHPGGGDRERERDPLRVRRIDRDDEPLRLLRVIALRERVIDHRAAGDDGRPHPCGDVERGAVDRHGGADPLGRLGAEHRLLLLEVLDEARALPRRVIELAIDDDRPACDRELLLPGRRRAARGARLASTGHREPEQQQQQHEPAHRARRYPRSSNSFAIVHAR